MIAERDVGLPKALWQERKERHHNQPDVEAPERDGEQPLVPHGWVGEATQAEEHESQAQHAVYAKQGRMAMRGRRIQSLHVIERNRRVYQKAEEPGTNKIPDQPRREKAERPAVDVFPFILPLDFRAIVRFEANNSERHHLKRRKHTPQRQHARWRAAPVEVMERAQDATAEE